MKKRTVIILLSSVMLFAIFNSGCGPLKPVGKFYDNFTSYYNTFYNIKKKFNEAERIRRKNIREHQDPNTEPTIPITTYQAVIESGASLLEYYPNCRWIDDTLLLMGISYARLGEYGRAERKFSELITIFEKSEHLSSAYVWKARVIAKQGRAEEAEKGLLAALPRIKQRLQLAQANLTLAGFYADKEQWSDASTYYELAAKNIDGKDERNDAYFALGKALLQQKQYESAREAFIRVIDHSRNTRQVFNASILWSRCAIQLGDFEAAESLLLKLRRSPEFDILRSAIDVEVAALSVATGQIDRGIELYQEFINQSDNSAEKGIAYYRLGEIYRDSKVDLVTAKSKFDSVSSAGAARSLIDSAKTASDGLSRGLLAIARIGALKDSITMYESEADSLRNIDWSNVMDDIETASTDSSGAFLDTTLMGMDVDSIEMDSLRLDTVSIVADSAETDSMVTEQKEDSVLKWKGPSPAAMLADSLLHAIKADRETTEDSTVVDTLLAEPVLEEEDAISLKERRARERIQFLDSSVVVLRMNLMSTYLHSAEFFDEVLNESDSSLTYLELAASEPCQHENYWKAALQLANRLSESDTVDHDRITTLYQQALSVEGIPISVENRIREKLGQEQQTIEIPEQEALLMKAEAAYLIGDVTPDSVISLYRRVVEFDSTSTYGLQAWFALEYIYENELEDFEIAAQLTQTIIDLFPDSSFVSELNAKLQELPSNTIFDMTDEEIADLRLKAHQTLAMKPDSTGWPPPEESLKGRRYR